MKSAPQTTVIGLEFMKSEAGQRLLVEVLYKIALKTKALDLPIERLPQTRAAKALTLTTLPMGGQSGAALPSPTGAVALT